MKFKDIIEDLLGGDVFTNQEGVKVCFDEHGLLIDRQYEGDKYQSEGMFDEFLIEQYDFQRDDWEKVTNLGEKKNYDS